MKPTDIKTPDYFHKVVDFQWACPAHTPVPEYIRLIAHGRYSDAYMINWKSNVFPGILGRTCDRPCEPACRRSRVEDETLVKGKKEPVAICRLKRVAADYKDDDIAVRMPKAPTKNGKRIACIGGGPASLTVARDLAVLGYEIVIYDQDPKLGGFIRTQIPHFRLPESVIDEEVGFITDIGNIEFRHQRIDSMKAVLAEKYDAVFVGCGAQLAPLTSFVPLRQGAPSQLLKRATHARPALLRSRPRTNRPAAGPACARAAFVACEQTPPRGAALHGDPGSCAVNARGRAAQRLGAARAACLND